MITNSSPGRSAQPLLGVEADDRGAVSRGLWRDLPGVAIDHLEGRRQTTVDGASGIFRTYLLPQRTAGEAAPAIDHRYLSDPDGHDLAVLRDGLVLAEALLDHPTLASVLGREISDMSTDEAIHATVAHYYHPVGSCPMGTGPGAVCDERGRVHGVTDVVVGDVCLMPQIPRGNTNLPAVMVGERIADLLGAD